jgi:hypothetical protein
MIGSEKAVKTANFFLAVIALFGLTSTLCLGAIYFQGAKVRTTEAKQIEDLQRDNKALHKVVDGLMGKYVEKGPYGRP